MSGQGPDNLGLCPTESVALAHTALTETAAAGLPAMFVQAKAGHAQGSTTERYLHASKASFPNAAELAESRLFATVEVPNAVPSSEEQAA